MKNPKLAFTERIHRARGSLSPSDRKIADYLLRSYPTGLLENASSIAKALNLNVSTVSRFFPKIGYGSIKGAHEDVREAVNFLMASPLARTPARIRPVKDETALFQQVLHLDLKNIQETFKDLSLADVRKFMRLLLDRERSVFVFGARKHFSLCLYTFIQLNGVRENVFLAPMGNFYVADLLSRARSGDILWLFDFRRYPRLSGRVAEYFRKVDGQVILFTDSAMAPQAPLADLRFIISTRGASSFDSYTAATSLVNAVLAEYVRLAADSVRERYAVQEQLFRHFDIFTWHEGIPVGQGPR